MDIRKKKMKKGSWNGGKRRRINKRKEGKGGEGK